MPAEEPLPAAAVPTQVPLSEPAEPKPSAVLSTATAKRAELDRLGFKDKSGWNDVRAQKQDNAAALLELRLQESRKEITKNSWKDSPCRVPFKHPWGSG
jgi:hypothetical protein